MPTAPAFWMHDGLPARLLAPLGGITAGITARRVAKPGWTAPAPVICCGNVTLGGAGKTTLVLDLAARLTGVHILLRGYGGSIAGPYRVTEADIAPVTGDEALLLAQVAPTWIGADRAASARAAIAAGARVLLMDDGLQNPSLRKTASLLVIDGATGFGNRRVFPAGPLREPIQAGAARCAAAIMIGPDATNAAAALPPDLPILRADLQQDAAIHTLANCRILPFAGIARPGKFFTPLRKAGAILVAERPFPDHHLYTPKHLAALAQEAQARDAILVTTPKDAVRLPPEFRPRVTVIGVGLRWREPGKIEALLDKVIANHPASMR